MRDLSREEEAVTSRRLALPEQRGDGDVESVGDVESGLRGNVNLAVFDPVDLEVRRPEFVSELLPAQLLGGPDLLDPASHKRQFIGHTPRISDLDISTQAVSGTVTEVRDSLGSVRRPDEDLTPEACELWMLDVGYKRDNGKLDHASAMHDADVKSKWAVVKMRWKDGEAPEDRAKIIAALLEKDRRRPTPSVLARRLIALEQWEALALDLLEDVDIFEKQIDEAKKSAAVAKAKAAAREATQRADAMEAALPFASQVPSPDPNKRTRK